MFPFIGKVLYTIRVSPLLSGLGALKKE